MTRDVSMTLLSVAFTLAHTLDEIVSDGGPVWDYLSRVLGLRSRLLAACAYVLFQQAVVALPLLALLYGDAFVVALLVVRLADVTVTHFVLWLVDELRPNPGQVTAPCLVLEAVAWALVLVSR